MSSWIYLINDEETLIEMEEQAYGAEVQIQELLEKYLNLLAGDRIDSTARWCPTDQHRIRYDLKKLFDCKLERQRNKVGMLSRREAKRRIFT